MGADADADATTAICKMQLVEENQSIEAGLAKEETKVEREQRVSGKMQEKCFSGKCQVISRLKLAADERDETDETCQSPSSNAFLPVSLPLQIGSICCSNALLLDRV